MQAFALKSLGEAGSVLDLPDPKPQEGEVLVRIKAAGVNVFDPWVVHGAMKDAMEHRFPLVPGVEASGVVETLGAGVTAFAEGGEVYGVSVKPFLGEGTYAELATFPADGISAKPQSVDQLAAGRGARVVAVASSERADYARELGASETIDYAKGDLLERVRSAHPDGVDALVDFYSDEPALARLSEVVRSGGKVLSASGAAGPEVLAQRGLRGGNINRAGPERLPELTRLVDEKQLQPPSTQVYPLERAGEALEQMQSRHVRGKLVISVE